MLTGLVGKMVMICAVGSMASMMCREKRKSASHSVSKCSGMAILKVILFFACEEQKCSRKHELF